MLAIHSKSTEIGKFPSSGYVWVARASSLASMPDQEPSLETAVLHDDHRPHPFVSVPPRDETGLWGPEASRALARECSNSLPLENALHRYRDAHGLSSQELRLVGCAMSGFNDKVAADILQCSPNTVGTYWRRIYAKVGCTCAREVIAHFCRFALSSA